MKKIHSKLMLIALAVFLTGSCSDDDSINTKVSAVNALYTPADNTFFNLGAQSSAVFEWEGAKAADNGVVLYDVVFDRENGDFSDPVYVMPSDGNGFQRTLNLSFTDLNRIAGMAGIGAEETGKLKWTVWSSKGIDVQTTSVSGIFEVLRPAGFPPPDQLFITGSASEGGDNAADARPFKKTGATTYEIYTALHTGEYKFITTTSGSTPETFYILDGNLKADGVSTYSGDEKVYRIKVDFSDGSTNVVEVEKLEIWFPPNGEYLFEYTYVGNGKWEAYDQYIEFKQETWGRDERYKFKFTINDAGNSVEEWFGSVNADNNKPDANSPASYWYMVPVTDDYWSNSFKFAAEVDYSTVDAQVDFSATADAYTHSFTIQ